MHKNVQQCLTVYNSAQPCNMFKRVKKLKMDSIGMNKERYPLWAPYLKTIIVRLKPEGSASIEVCYGVNSASTVEELIMIQKFITSFREAIQLAGIRPPEIIYDDGQLHRFGTSEKPGDKAGWYILYGDGIPAGSFGDWRTGANHSWHADVGRTFTEAEKLAHQKSNTMRQAREAAEEKGGIML